MKISGKDAKPQKKPQGWIIMGELKPVNMAHQL
jgi:hypothetical protein